ncbi:hypothetical protein GIB67_035168 [Kingdonia uniflora]|uniref:Uncharacterized protein n=1 Tax=Kingdonia uniflora TaxID=39325 RepID=A0A7J7LDI3_9MAGN|nr:hypothetical protein GIB67_035168 [Kingdonia uniflora]
MESTQRERQKITGINQELSEDDKRLKRAKVSGPRRWEYYRVVRGKLDSTADSHPDIEGSAAFKEFCKAKGAIGGMWGKYVEFPAGQTWNENIIWVKGNCLQRDDDELLDLRFRSVKQSVKSAVEKKKSLLDQVAEEETELELVLGELSLSRKNRVESRSKKVVKAQSTRSMTGVNERQRQTSGEKVRSKTPGSGSSAQPNLTTSKIAQKFLKRQVKKALPASGITVSGEVAQGKRKRVEPLGGSREKVAEGQSALVDDLKEVEERTRLAILQGKEDTSQMESEMKKAKRELEKNLARAKTDALKEVKQLKAAHAMVIGQLQVEAKANLDEMTEEIEVLGAMDGLDGISPQMVLDNQGDDVELPKGRSEKVVREMCLRINDLESGFAREREKLKALLSAQAELQQFDRMKEANENREDQCVKVHFRLVKLNRVISDLTRLVVERDSGIRKGLGDLSAATECVKNLQRQVDALAMKGMQADMAQYRIQALEQTEELCRSDLHRCRINLERMGHKFIGKDDELRVA